jgi:(R)-amidase
MLALLAQLESVPEDPGANAARAVAALEAHPAADLAVFPELFLSAYDLAGVAESARPAGCDELRLVAAAAAAVSTAVVIGFAERLDGGGVANAAACIDADGELVGVYRKTQLFGAEQAAFEAGRELNVVDLAGRAVGPLICFDVEFPEPARQLALAGAELLVTASANMEPFGDDHELASRARALENRLPHLYVNAVGTPGGNRLVGRSRAIGPGGDVLAEAPEHAEALLVVPVPTAGAEDDRVEYLRYLPDDLPVVLRRRTGRP